MIAFGEWRWKQSNRVGDATVADHMAAVKKKLGPAAIKLGPALPIEGAWLWGAFCALDAKRPRDFGLGAISYSEMAHYAFLFGFRWTPPEIAVMDALDIAYRSFAAKEKPKPTTR